MRAACALVVVLVATGLRTAGPATAVWPAAIAGETVTLEAEADTTVSADRPTVNGGSSGTLRVNGKPRLDSYLRFRIPAGVGGRAVLRLWVLAPTVDGPTLRRYDGRFAEAGAQRRGREPRLVGVPVDTGALEAGSWAEWDVSPLVTGPGEVTFVLMADSSDGVEFASRESDRKPQLVIGPAPGGTPPSPSLPPAPSPPAPAPPTTTTTAPGESPGPWAPPECGPGWGPAEPVAELGDGLGEMSAFIASPTHPGWGWGVRDSGKPASLYAMNPGDGGTVRTQEFPAYDLKNHDWEDVTHTPGPEPGTGHLWVLENVGNGWDGDRWIYQFAEPDPDPAPPAVPAATLVGAYQWAYPDTQVNTETMFVFDGDLVVVTKSDPSRVYRFSGPLLPSVVNVPAYVGTLPAGHRLSVGALSADQRTLVVSNHGRVDAYVNRGDPGDLAALIANHSFEQRMPADNREGGSFFPHGSCDILLVAESKTIWRLEHR